eukprot:g11353.t1
MNVNIDIEDLLALETRLKAERESATSSICLDAKLNIVKFLQVQTVEQYQAAYDDLHYDLFKEGGIECLRNIAPVRSKDLLQPKVLELQGCDEDAQLAKQLEFFLADAEGTKQCLDTLVAKAAQDLNKCEVQYVDVKSLESTRRKASKFCGGDVRKVADMARVTVICDTPKALEQVYSNIMGLLQAQNVLRVKNGFNSDWMPGGYRDVKVNPVLNQHLCEIQLQLRAFFALKSGQHVVYTWARDLKVSTKIRAENLFENLSPEVTGEMINLTRQNWQGSGFYLPDLQLETGQHHLAEEGFRQQLRESEDVLRCKPHGSREWREALLRVNSVRADLGHVLFTKNMFAEADSLFLRCIEIGEEALGREHPDLASSLNNRAALLKAQGKYAEAEPLFARSQAIVETVLGPSIPMWLHP